VRRRATRERAPVRMFDGMYSAGRGMSGTWYANLALQTSNAIVFNELQTSLIFMMQAGLTDRNYNNCQYQQ
jgi:hypothetical protein